MKCAEERFFRTANVIKAACGLVFFLKNVEGIFTVFCQIEA